MCIILFGNEKSYLESLYSEAETSKTGQNTDKIIINFSSHSFQNLIKVHSARI